MTYTPSRRPRRRRWQQNSRRPNAYRMLRRRLGHELLEDRRLLAVDLVFDYSFDTSDFFADQSRRDALERAATVFESRLADELTAISAAGSNTWTAVFSHPETGNEHTITDLEIPADTLIIFVASRDISNLGIGGPGGYQVSGTSDFVNNMVTRGQTGIATGSEESSSNTDFSPWGGNLSFSSNASWNYSTDPPRQDKTISTRSPCTNWDTC